MKSSDDYPLFQPGVNYMPRRSFPEPIERVNADPTQSSQTWRYQIIRESVSRRRLGLDTRERLDLRYRLRGA